MLDVCLGSPSEFKFAFVVIVRAAGVLAARHFQHHGGRGFVTKDSDWLLVARVGDATLGSPPSSFSLPCPCRT